MGGTNPSLLEALTSTKINLLYDVGFNREVANSSALYWSKTEGILAKLIQRVEKISAADIEKMSKQSTERIIRCYSWENIIEKYEKVF